MDPDNPQEDKEAQMDTAHTAGDSPVAWSGDASGRGWSSLPDLAERVNRLFETSLTVDPGTGRVRHHSNDDVSSALVLKGIRCSPSNLSLIRSGRRDNPTAALIAGLAEFFQVTPMYFFDPVVATQVEAYLDLRNENLIAQARATRAV
ncbi:hypothetical protein FB459_2198 [Yimella lutea]|uniref:HTH cro/C1-type domain-containing protein n=1 Tax=Yimella lutea TaxID=587872 RepID=A0A542EH86_9MICO|nr:hypothetical protein FB459_2198 [Yimella lutea]